MIDRKWAKGLVEAARSILWESNSVAPTVQEDELIALSGLRPAVSEIERLILVGICCDLRSKLADALAVDRNDQEMKSVLLYLHCHSRDPRVTRANAARALGLSESWLAHRLKTRTGRSFREHLSDIRFKDACLQLEDTSCSVKKAALTAGFSSAGACSKQFQRRLGTSPANWRVGSLRNNVVSSGKRVAEWSTNDSDR